MKSKIIIHNETELGDSTALDYILQIVKRNSINNTKIDSEKYFNGVSVDCKYTDSESEFWFQDK